MDLFPLGLIPLILGVLCVVFHKQFGRDSKEFQSKWFGSDCDEKLFTAPYLIGGLLLMTLGVLMLFGVIRR